VNEHRKTGRGIQHSLVLLRRDGWDSRFCARRFFTDTRYADTPGAFLVAALLPCVSPAKHISLTGHHDRAFISYSGKAQDY
jgi:hypothetical protein